MNRTRKLIEKGRAKNEKVSLFLKKGDVNQKIIPV